MNELQHNNTDLELQTLVHRFREGFRPAIAKILEACRGPLFSYLYRLCRNVELSEDLLQETFLAIHSGIATFDATRRFMPWAFAVARNKFLEWKRRECRVVRLVPRAAGPTAGGNADSTPEAAANPKNARAMPPPLRSAQDAETAAQTSDHAPTVGVRIDVERALNELSEPIREAFILKHFNGLRFQEVAEVQQVPESTAKSRVAFAIQKLKEALSR